MHGKPSLDNEEEECTAVVKKKEDKGLELLEGYASVIKKNVYPANAPERKFNLIVYGKDWQKKHHKL